MFKRVQQSTPNITRSDKIQHVRSTLYINTLCMETQHRKAASVQRTKDVESYAQFEAPLTQRSGYLTMPYHPLRMQLHYRELKSKRHSFLFLKMRNKHSLSHMIEIITNG